MSGSGQAVNGIIYAVVIIAFCSFFTIFVFTGYVLHTHSYPGVCS
jgi:hypothetical protein